MKEGLGYSLAPPSLVITLVTVVQIGGIAIGWWIGDSFDKRLIAAACMLMHTAGLLLLTYRDAAPRCRRFRAAARRRLGACAGRSCRRSAPTTSAAARSA